MENTIPTTKNGQPKYVIHKDGNNQEYKVVNFNNPEMVPNVGIKIVKAIRKSSRHQPSSSIRIHRDKIEGIIYAIPAGLDDYTKNMKFQLIEINDLRQFDLTNLQDRMEWSVISRAPFLEGSPNASGKPSHVLHDPEAEAVKKIANVKDKDAANKVMENLSEMQIIDMARNVGGIDTRNNSLIIIKGELYDFIDSKEPNKGAKKFNQIWSMSNREAFTVFERCKEVGLVHFDVNNGWLWKKASQLGTSEPMAIEYITKNPSLLMSMDNESRSMDDKFESFATDEEKQKIITAMPNINKNVDPNILKEQEAIVARMSAKEKLLDELLDKAAKLHPVDLDEKPVEVAPEDASELRLLQYEARKYGMKHAYTVKDPEKIRKWMAENPATT